MKKKIKTISKKTPKKTPIKTIKKVSKRGRPPKEFISKKPQIKREGPGRPRKEERVALPQIPEKKENKVKDAIILALFLISFFIFGFSVYVSQKEKINDFFSKNNEIITSPTIETTGEVIQTGKEETKQIESEVSAPIENNKITILEQTYEAIKQGNTDGIYAHIDNSLKQTSIFKTYFSKNRLQRFIDNIDNKTLNIKAEPTTDDSSTIKYTVTYSIKNTLFVEEREASFIQKNNEDKIAKIMCITQGCSKMPFFNPGKYF